MLLALIRKALRIALALAVVDWLECRV